MTRAPRIARLALAVAALLAAAARAPAHDFWIQPQSFQPETGTLLPVQLLVGDDGVGKPVERDGKRIERFVLVDAAGERPIVGPDGGLPAGFVRLAPAEFRIASAGAGVGASLRASVTADATASAAADDLVGVVVLGYRSRHARVELEPGKFEEYARLEGLEPILQERAERGQVGLPAREAYSRCAKSLVRVQPRDGAAPGCATADRVLGFTLELVAEENPFELASGADGRAPLHVRLLFEGRPLAGALVRATPLPHAPRADDPPAAFGAPGLQPLRVRTDAEGRAALDLPRRGDWLVTAVHMRPAPEGLTDVSDVDWESFWASLTFELPEQAPAR